MSDKQVDIDAKTLETLEALMLLDPLLSHLTTTKAKVGHVLTQYIRAKRTPASPADALGLPE